MEQYLYIKLIDSCDVCFCSFKSEESFERLEMNFIVSLSFLVMQGRNQIKIIFKAIFL